MAIKTSVINSFNRVGIDYMAVNHTVKHVEVQNRFNGETVQTTELVAKCIDWVYNTSNAYERGDYSVKIADFDRIRYFVLAEDSKAYSVCLD